MSGGEKAELERCSSDVPLNVAHAPQETWPRKQKTSLSASPRGFLQKTRRTRLKVAGKLVGC